LKNDLDIVIGIRNAIGICILFWICMWLMGCGTYTSQVIKWSGKVHLYTDEFERDRYCSRLVKRDVIASCYNPKDNSIHVMKWDFEAAGHELFHGLALDGSPSLIVEDRFDHFKVKHKFIIKRKNQ
jgi:hypothetical protein